jgi:hypothetical protein
MPRLNRQNIDRKTNKPEFDRVESLNGDRVLNRATQTRRDDDVTLKHLTEHYMILIMQ